MGKAEGDLECTLEMFPGLTEITIDVAGLISNTDIPDSSHSTTSCPQIGDNSTVESFVQKCLWKYYMLDFGPQYEGYLPFAHLNFFYKLLAMQ
jgi:hypothetical protein